MGLRNLRAICPNCGAKIHTQPKGIGRISWVNTWMFTETGQECPYCGVELTGNVLPGQRAELAPPPLAVKRYRVTGQDGEIREFTDYTEAVVHKAATDGHLSPV